MSSLMQLLISRPVQKLSHSCEPPAVAPLSWVKVATLGAALAKGLLLLANGLGAL